MIDYKRFNNVRVRNTKEAVDFHDVVKILIYRILRRRYPKAEIYTEFNPLNPNEEYPDIWMRLKKDLYVWELQEEITKSWTDQILLKYVDYDVVIVPLKALRQAWVNSAKHEKDPLVALTNLLEGYVI